MRFHYYLFVILLMTLCSCGHSRRLHRREQRRQPTREETVAVKHDDKKYTPQSYIDAWKGVAIKQMKQYGIPASIVLAQALLESANGNSALAREANNHFGIKCTNDWTGKTYHKNGEGGGDCWRKYNNASESFADHSKFLQKTRYADLFKLGSTDYKGWARGLKKAGYATNPKYPELLINMVDKYNLQQYDR